MQENKYLKWANERFRGGVGCLLFAALLIGLGRMHNAEAYRVGIIIAILGLLLITQAYTGQDAITDNQDAREP